ncbi:MAG: metal ABC transporter ATP-binding protein [Neomegalonema sp.]|nr:metal ABC transporter ATP-binding protein [Neomegalonema sp.]
MALSLATASAAPDLAASAPLIVAHNVSAKGDHGETILRGVNLTIARGEIVTIVGPNGGGKTTLTRCLIGARPISAGRVERAHGLRVGYAPQKLAVDRVMPLDVDGFLALGARSTRRQREQALDRVGALRLARRQLADLSGGETQRALLARALLRAPNLLALDEPTRGLDQQGVAEFYRMLAEIRSAEAELSVLLVSHDLTVVMAASDRVLCVNGHICCAGAPEDVETHPEYRKLIGAEDADALAVYQHHHDHTHQAVGRR